MSFHPSDFVVRETDPSLDNNTSALSEEDAIACRVNKTNSSIEHMAKRYGVTVKAVTRCVYGKTYKFLDKRFPPWKR